jgi:hypothetical protein
VKPISGALILFWLSFVILFGCASSTTKTYEAKISKKHRTLICGEVRNVGDGSVPDDIRYSFLKQKGNKILHVYTEWYDITPNAEYTVKWEYYLEDQFIATSKRKFKTPDDKYMTAGTVKLDPKYKNIPSGIITCKIFLNDVYITTTHFILAENKEELVKLERIYEEKFANSTPENVGPKEEINKSGVGNKLPAENWAIIVGISKYQQSRKNNFKNLIFADDDAKSFARVLRNIGWEEDHIKLLIDEEATQRNIMIAIESWITKSNENDQIVLFWSGHGYADPEDPEKVYFACHDTDITIPATGYRMDKIRSALEEIKSRNVIIFADTCHAGKLITRGSKGLSIVPNISKMRREGTVPKGWIYMVGADTDREAIEHSSWKNGAFTHCLLEALSGKADGYESVDAEDGIITMSELRAYLNTAMPEQTQRILGKAMEKLRSSRTI